jgi:hypothetical protein
MKTIRRIYIYAVTLVSLEVVVWGLIGLARSAFAGDEIGGDVTRLAGALALLFVGIPVFLLHWWLAQKSAREDEDERSSYIRALFLYGALLFTLVPVTQNIFAIINRLFFSFVDVTSNQVMFGADQTLIDNLIAIVMNGLIATYVFSVLRKDWATPPAGYSLADVRRIYRYIWVLYGLIMMTFGVQQTLLYIFDYIGDAISASQAILVNGLTLTLVGTPIWIFSWRILQKSMSDPHEQRSLMRAIILSLVSFIAQVATLVAAGMILYVILDGLLDGHFNFTGFIDDIRDPISVMIPFGMVWRYYRTILQGALETELQVGVRRLFTYVISFIGLVVAFVGLYDLLAYVIAVILDETYYLRELSEALSLLIMGTPVWLLNWRKVNGPAGLDNEEGEQARRSIIRKIYLYLVLFISVIGVMVSAGNLIYQLLRAALGEPTSNLLQTALELVSILVLFALVIWYHGVVLRKDSRLSNKAQTNRHAEFPILILISEFGDFSEMLTEAFSKEMPSLPVAVHVVEQGVPDDDLSDAKAVILPASLAANPGEAIRLWLQDFPGIRFVVPTPVQGWVWITGNGSPLQSLIRQTVEMVKKLAEGVDIYKTRSTSTWMIIGYIFGGVFGLWLLFVLLTILNEFL